MADNTEGKSFFKRIINTIIGTPDAPPSNENEEVGPYGPQRDVPVDEKFAKNYTQNGGHFIYVTDLNDATLNLKNIIDELGVAKIFCQDAQLNELLHLSGLQDRLCEKHKEAEIYFTSSEFLIAHDGGIMMTSNQLNGIKPSELPNNYVIIGRTSKIVDKLSDAMAGIKDIYKGNIPTQISTLKGPKSECSSSGDSRESSKTLFLLLLEDV
ncbi:MAG: lactate utilization protein [Schleiferiaceae bacterium]|nr:lactate utilization protein [Schleiferiaceae bacterium]